MNENNQISATTKLFGFIAEKAQSNRFSVLLNQQFKTQGQDAMVIPMNIRHDDLYFTISNMRQSQLMGAAIGVEYQKEVVEILDVQSDLVRQCGFCDTILVRDGQLYGDVRSAYGVLGFFKKREMTRVAVIGGGALAKSLALCQDGMEIHFFHEYVEALMEMCNTLSIEVDMNRLGAGMAVDLSGYDVVIDACRMEHLEMITAMPKYGVDLRAKGVYSPLKVRCEVLGAEYFGYEALLPDITQSVYETWTQEEERS